MNVLCQGPTPIPYPLKENMVIAVEPKKRIEGVGLVGIENTFQITPEGGKRLTPGLDEIRILSLNFLASHSDPFPHGTHYIDRIDQRLRGRCPYAA